MSPQNIDVVDLSSESKNPILSFLLFKKLRYSRRLMLAVGFAVVGLTVQAYSGQVVPGLPFLIISVGLTWASGLQVNAGFQRLNIKGDWVPAGVEELDKLLAIYKRSRNWDDTVFEISNALGFGLFLVILFFLVVLKLFANDILFYDAIVLIALQWFIGWRSYIYRNRPIRMAAHLKMVLEKFPKLYEDKKYNSAKFGLQMHVVGNEERKEPRDIKLSISWSQGPEYFYGVQGQVVLNNVRGTLYPYFYTIVLCKAGFHLDELTQGVAIPERVIRETKTKDNVDIVIFRQDADFSYTTQLSTSVFILHCAMEAAEKFLQACKEE